MNIPSLVIGLAAGLFIGILACILYRNKKAKDDKEKIANAEEEALRIINDAIKSAESKKREATLEAKEEILRSRKEYKGSGTPTAFMSEDALTEMLLLEDTIGHPLYADEAALARKLRVAKIVTVPRMEGMKGAKGGDLACLIVNLADYTVGADKGGAVSMFDDFDIDFNAMKYLIETRCSGALTTPYSAIAVEFAA